MINNKNNNKANSQPITKEIANDNPFGKSDWLAVHNHLNSLVKKIIGESRSSSDKWELILV